jgi:hypothetical protein
MTEGHWAGCIKMKVRARSSVGLEHLPSKQRVAGSNPAGRAIHSLIQCPAKTASTNRSVLIARLRWHRLPNLRIEMCATGRPFRAAA